MNDNIVSRIQLLMQQSKYAEAERLLKELLHSDANNVHFLALLAEVHLQQDKFESARNIIDNAIGIEPDWPHLFYTKSRIAIQEDKLDEAEQYIKQSIALDPEDADYFSMLANIEMVRKKYESALEHADQALELDPENLLALNTRSRALLKLNKKEESFQTIEGALREDPNNAYTHANYGWGLLEKGDHKKALQHFREALKNNPGLGFAQSGMMEALKASNPVYKLFLKYSFWISNLTAKYQWGVIIGFYLLVRVLRGLALANEGLRPFLIPVIIILTIFAFSTWIITPVSNLFLRFNAYGNFLLDRNEKMNSNFVAGSFVILLAGLLLLFLLKDERYVTVAVFGFAMMVPFSSMFSNAKHKNVMLIYAISMAITGIASIAITFLTGEIFNMLSIIFVIGFVAYQWVANYFSIRADNK